MVLLVDVGVERRVVEEAMAEVEENIFDKGEENYLPADLQHGGDGVGVKTSPREQALQKGE